MKILITGSTGLIGSYLSEHLKQQGHSVFPLHRNPKSKERFYWRPDENFIHIDDEIKLDAVIHLAGENIAEGRWNQTRKDRILNSRVEGTRMLTGALSNLNNKPEVLISASAIGFYGDTADVAVDESKQRGTGFLSDIASQWEAETKAAKDTGIRTIHLRTGIVLSLDGGALKKMLPAFRMGVGGRIGDGKQYMSWISIHDVIHIISRMLTHKKMSGPYNLVSPKPVTNREFTQTLGRALNRPTVFPMPAIIARILFGEMADPLLLSSCKVTPKKLQKDGYSFIAEDLDTALIQLLDDKKPVLHHA